MCLEIRNCNLIFFFFQTEKSLCHQLKKQLDVCCLNKCLMRSNMENNTDTDYLGYMVLLKNGEGTW